MDLTSRSITYQWREKFYLMIAGAPYATEPVGDWVKSILNISRKCDFEKGFYKDHLFNLIVFCMRNGPEKTEIKRRFIEGSIQNLPDLLAFFKSFRTTRDPQSVKANHHNSKRPLGVERVHYNNSEENLPNGEVSYNAAKYVKLEQSYNHDESYENNGPEEMQVNCDSSVFEHMQSGEYTNFDDESDQNDTQVPEGGSGHPCTLCGEVLSKKWRLKRHMDVVHLKIKKSSCEICGKAFGDNWKMKRHMMTHSDLRQFQCSVCGKLFSRHTNVRNHLMKVHHIEQLAADTLINKLEEPIPGSEDPTLKNKDEDPAPTDEDGAPKVSHNPEESSQTSQPENPAPSYKVEYPTPSNGQENLAPITKLENSTLTTYH